MEATLHAKWPQPQAIAPLSFRTGGEPGSCWHSGPLVASTPSQLQVALIKANFVLKSHSEKNNAAVQPRGSSTVGLCANRGSSRGSRCGSDCRSQFERGFMKENSPWLVSLVCRSASLCSTHVLYNRAGVRTMHNFVDGREQRVLLLPALEPQYLLHLPPVQLHSAD